VATVVFHAFPATALKSVPSASFRPARARFPLASAPPRAAFGIYEALW
jgi:hypothetical protein